MFLQYPKDFIRCTSELPCSTSAVHSLQAMAEKGDSSDEEPTIAEDVVVTKYKMAGDMSNSESVGAACRMSILCK